MHSKEPIEVKSRIADRWVTVLWENLPMAIKFDVPHGIGADEARNRLYGQAQERGVPVEPDGTRPGNPHAGEVEHSTPMGNVRVRFLILETSINVEVVKKPTFAPAAMLRSEMEKRLRDLLS
jgi:hypothetical protein